MSTTETTTERPLPVDRQTLRAYMPDEPVSGVSKARTAITLLDTVIAAVREELTVRDEQDHRLVTDVVNTAMSGGRLDPVVARLVPGDRAALTHKLEQLHVARSLAGHKQTEAEYHDETFLGWKAQCLEVEREWQLCNSADTPEDKFKALVSFAGRH